MTGSEISAVSSDCGDASDARRHAHDVASAREEARELVELLNCLIDHHPPIEERGLALAVTLERSLDTENSPHAMELHLEQFSRQMRALWLRSVNSETSWVLRSPTDREAKRLSIRHDAFGYERDLQPYELEGRCNSFFGTVPAPWKAEHVIFSSGQAALLSLLLAFKSRRPLRVQHLGGYFETRQLVQSCPSLCALVETDADIVIAEPVASNGGFAYHGEEEIAGAVAGAKALVLDTTLLGRTDGIDGLLSELDRSLLVLRCASGLKLLQAGLELANVGIVGVHSRSEETLAQFAGALREMRTLCGSGLRYADVLALEAPFVFDPLYADRYAGALFAHNAALAEAVTAQNRLFVPPFSTDPSPYCVFSLKDQSEEAYHRLADLIAATARARKILLDRGGSFGFRGHRYEIVRPENQPPFLRIAMGRRPGWSCRGVIELMAEIAACSSIRSQATG